MTTMSKPIYVDTKAQESLLAFVKSTQVSILNNSNMDLRQRFQQIDKEYIRENNMANDQSVQAKAANAQGNKRKIQDIVIPIAEPQCESALASLAAVFLTGSPIFGVVAGQKLMPQAKMLEAVVSNNSTVGGWVRHLLMFLNDGLKYNFSSVEVDWCTRKTYSIGTDVVKNAKEGTLKETQWQGNTIKRLDPYNTIFDPRVKLCEQHLKAEFVGYIEVHNRVSLAEFLQSLPYRINVTEAYSSTVQLMSGVGNLYYVPEVFSDNFSAAKASGVMNWDMWATAGKKNPKMEYKNLYQVITRYIRIIPRDYGIAVPASGNVQIWKVITVNDAVIVYAERLSNAHGMLPIIFGQPNEDGLDLQTKSFVQKQIPLQDIASALANSKLASRRRLISDRGLFDPSRVDEKNINSDNPSAKIPVRPTAYGQDMSKAYYPIPFKDDQTTTLMQDVREVQGYADYLSGQNRAQQGQFVKGNKTKSEYEDVQNKSSGRQQLMALRLEHQVFVPVKQILLLNTLQYQPDGPIYTDAEQEPVNVNMMQLRNAGLQFKVSDGLDPSDKLISGDILTTALQGALQSPELNEEWDVGAIFGELLSIRSNFDMNQFKRTPEQIQKRNDQKVALEQAKRTPPQAGQPPQGQPNGTPVQ